MILTITLAVLLARSREPYLRRLRPFGWLAVGLVFVQALLGGITVLLRLPTPISTAHTATSLLFFLTVLYVAVRSTPPELLPAGGLHLGGTGRARGRRGRLLPDGDRRTGPAFGGGAGLHRCPALPRLAVADAHPTVLIQALHRLNATVVGTLVLVSSVVTWRGATPALRPARAGAAGPGSRRRADLAGPAVGAHLPRPRHGGVAPRRRHRPARHAAADRAPRRSRGGARAGHAAVVRRHGEPVQAPHHGPGGDHVPGRALVGAGRDRPLASDHDAARNRLPRRGLQHHQHVPRARLSIR